MEEVQRNRNTTSTGEDMKQVLVLMKAMPPTVGHKALIEFAMNLGFVQVLIDVKSDEPMIDERVAAVRKMLPVGRGRVDLIHVEEQDPTADGFWDEWDRQLNFAKGHTDYVVASEPYGIEVARRVGARFMPYDPDRELLDIHAEWIRENPAWYFGFIAPEFQPYLRTVTTIWGAESTGKTTLTNDLGYNAIAPTIFEWARPYLEMVGPDITTEAMHDIWHGQAALQRVAMKRPGYRFLIQDTDLFSTVGYWMQPHWEKELGPVPEGLIKEAIQLQSDLYIITRSNIPFEPDPIRYGGDKRESPDEFWIGIADKFGLNYIVLDQTDQKDRVFIANQKILEVSTAKLSKIKYDRKGF